jgi:tRNA(adenine34) deaminase
MEYTKKNEIFMAEAFKEAGSAFKKNEVPVGAVVVHKGEIVGRGHNMKEFSGDPTSHAEIIAIREAAGRLKGWRLDGSTIYVTIEPCIMCMGAVLQARVSTLVFGCYDPKAGACGSLYDLSNDSRLNHRVNVISGVGAEEAGYLLKRFFMGLRKRSGVKSTVKMTDSNRELKASR